MYEIRKLHRNIVLGNRIYPRTYLLEIVPKLATSSTLSHCGSWVSADQPFRKCADKCVETAELFRLYKSAQGLVFGNDPLRAARAVSHSESRKGDQHTDCDPQMIVCKTCGFSK